jgi:hypothetical protein
MDWPVEVRSEDPTLTNQTPANRLKRWQKFYEAVVYGAAHIALNVERTIPESRQAEPTFMITLARHHDHASQAHVAFSYSVHSCDSVLRFDLLRMLTTSAPPVTTN